MEDSLVVEQGMLVKFPLVPFAICLLHLQLLLQEPAVSKKYCKTDIWSRCRHTEVLAVSFPTSPSRQGSALRSTLRGVLICWHLDLQVSRAGL